METFLVSATSVALGEIGDKTQLLAVLLAARFRKPAWICLGILVATAANHAVAAALGHSFAALFTSPPVRILVGGMFIAMAAWLLIPDKPSELPHIGIDHPFLTTVILFFLVEIGDKTQILTSLLAAKYQSIAVVTLATVFGMLLVNVPTVYLGDALMARIPLRWINALSAAVLAFVGIVTIAAVLLT